MKRRSISSEKVIGVFFGIFLPSSYPVVHNQIQPQQSSKSISFTKPELHTLRDYCSLQCTTVVHVLEVVRVRRPGHMSRKCCGKSCVKAFPGNSLAHRYTPRARDSRACDCLFLAAITDLRSRDGNYHAWTLSFARKFALRVSAP